MNTIIQGVCHAKKTNSMKDEDLLFFCFYNKQYSHLIFLLAKKSQRCHMLYIDVKIVCDEKVIACYNS